MKSRRKPSPKGLVSNRSADTRLLGRVRRFVREQSLLLRGDRVLVAVSGGVDSMTLLHILCALRAELDLTLHVAHLDHRLRPDSTSDARFVRAQARRLGLPCTIETCDVAALARKTRSSLEAAGRRARTAFLQRAAEAHSCSKIALGHQQEDQVETFFINALRGAGLRGLGGMPPRRGRLVRPLLHCASGEIEAYAAAQGIEFRQDASNRDVRFRRNWLRLKLMPELQKLYPQLANTVCRNQAWLRQVEEYVRAQAHQALETCLKERGEDGIVLARDALLSLHPALQAEVIRIAAAALTKEGQGLAGRHVEAVLRQAAGPSSGGVVVLPQGWMAVVEAKTVRLRRLQAPLQPAPSLILPVPGKVQWGQWRIAAALRSPTGPFRRQQAKGLSVRMDWSTIKPPLEVRGRRAGDRIDPVGMKGHQKIQDILVDAKVPRLQRDTVPILVDQDGILWVAGYRQSRRTTPAEHTQQILELSACKVQ